jgi:hypothetical protein
MFTSGSKSASLSNEHRVREQKTGRWLKPGDSSINFSVLDACRFDL